MWPRAWRQVGGQPAAGGPLPLALRLWREGMVVFRVAPCGRRRVGGHPAGQQQAGMRPAWAAPSSLLAWPGCARLRPLADPPQHTWLVLSTRFSVGSVLNSSKGSPAAAGGRLLPTAGAALSGPAPPSDPVFINVEEKIGAVLNKDGGVENCEVQGTMSLQVRAGSGAGGSGGGWLGGDRWQVWDGPRVACEQGAGGWSGY